MFRHLAVCWALSAVSFVLLFAVYRLGQHALHLASLPLPLWQWFLLLGSVVLMGYSEGYKGFQKAFAPRFAARLRHIRDHASNGERLLAPFFCFGYFGTTRRRLISAYALSGMIIIFATLAGQLEQPWRGILDAGVVIGLLWGVLSVWWFSAQALSQADFPYSAELKHAP